VRDQLTDFDQVRFEKLIKLLGQSQEILQERLQRVEGYAEAFASMTADEFVGKQEGQGYSREDVFEANKEFELQEVRPKVYFWAVRLHAAVGQEVARWLEMFLPPAFPRVFYGEAGLADVRIDYSEGRKWIPPPSELLQLLANNSQDAARTFFSALLLGEAFGSLIEKSSLANLIILEAHESAFSSSVPVGIDWQRVWEHYLAFADLEAKRLTSGVPGTSSPGIQLASDEGAAYGRNPEEPNYTPNITINEAVESARFDHTVIMDRQEDIVRVLKQLQEAGGKAPDEMRRQCEATVQDALGVLLDEVEQPTKRCLITAEYHYTQTPVALDFSNVIVDFTRAFESELKRIIKQFPDGFQQAVSSDPEVKRKKPILKFTLGELSGLLKRNKPFFANLKGLFGTDGRLVYADVLSAIETVNQQAEAKHSGMRAKADATRFRSLFLGKPSIMAALFPRTEKPQAGPERSSAANGQD
jgi:hypothetical protein